MTATITEIQEFICSFREKREMVQRTQGGPGAGFLWRESHTVQMKPKSHLYLTWARFRQIQLSKSVYSL